MSDTQQLQAFDAHANTWRGDSRIRVWDRFVRFFHWSLVITFALSYWSAKAGRHELHAWLGYFLAGLILARFFWGIYGSRYARFSNFIHAPVAALNYLKAIAAGHPHRFLGHNPAGGIMVIALLTALAFITFTGLTALAVIDFDGPLVGLLHSMSDQQAYAALESHAIAVNVILIMVGLHLVGVVLASFQHKENLVAAMVTGYKSVGDEIAAPTASGPDDKRLQVPAYSTSLAEENKPI